MLSRTGGVWLGWLGASWPLAILSGDGDASRLSCFGREYVFLRSNIESLSKQRGMFSIGLRIKHTVPTYPQFVVFWVPPFPRSARFSSLKKELESLGYTVWE
jgi:hypothetical protein